MLIINVALTGMIPTKEQNPNLPVTPAEIGEDVRRCYEAGANLFHIHARDESGLPTWDGSIYRDIVLAIKARAPGAIICGSTSGRLWGDIDKRSAVLESGVDMASLTPGSFNFPTGPSVNDPSTIKALLGRMKEYGIVSELEIFDLGMLDYAAYLREKGLLKPPFYFNLLLGNLGTLAAKQINLLRMIGAIDKDFTGALWAATGIGRFQFDVNGWALALGGGVRVGLEDSIWMDRDKTDLASNVRQVERVVTLARSLGLQPATTAEVRQWLKSR